MCRVNNPWEIPRPINKLNYIYNSLASATKNFLSFFFRQFARKNDRKKFFFAFRNFLIDRRIDFCNV